MRKKSSCQPSLGPSSSIMHSAYGGFLMSDEERQATAITTPFGPHVYFSQSFRIVGRAIPKASCINSRVTSSKVHPLRAFPNYASSTTKRYSCLVVIQTEPRLRQ